MHVLQICHCYYPPFLDCARQYAVLFKGTGIKVTTVYLTGEPDPAVEQATCSDEVIFLGYKSNEVSGLKLDAIRRIRKIVAAKPYLFCIAHRSKPTYLALMATKLPVVSVRHSFNEFDRFSRRFLMNVFRKRLLILAVSNAVRDEIRAALPNWPHEKIETLYNHIDVDAVRNGLLTREAAREHLGLPESAWVMANVGRLHPDKDQATLIRAFAKALPNLPKESLLLLMGAGPLEQNLKQLTKDLGIEKQVIFTGQVSDGRRYFKAFDIFVLTSDHEPFGMVLLEAMAADLPIICSNCGGGAEVVGDVGLLFEFGNVSELSEVMLQMTHDGAGCSGEKLRMWLNVTFSDQAARGRFLELSILKKYSARGHT